MSVLAWSLGSCIPALAIGAWIVMRDDRKHAKLRQRMAEQQTEARNAKKAPSQNG